MKYPDHGLVIRGASLEYYLHNHLHDSLNLQPGYQGITKKKIRKEVKKFIQFYFPGRPPKDLTVKQFSLSNDPIISREIVKYVNKFLFENGSTAVTSVSLTDEKEVLENI